MDDLERLVLEVMLTGLKKSDSGALIVTTETRGRTRIDGEFDLDPIVRAMVGVVRDHYY